MVLSISLPQNLRKVLLSSWKNGSLVQLARDRCGARAAHGEWQSDRRSFDGRKVSVALARRSRKLPRISDPARILDLFRVLDRKSVV